MEKIDEYVQAAFQSIANFLAPLIRCFKIAVLCLAISNICVILYFEKNIPFSLFLIVILFPINSVFIARRILSYEDASVYRHVLSTPKWYKLIYIFFPVLQIATIRTVDLYGAFMFLLGCTIYFSSCLYIPPPKQEFATEQG